MTDDPQLIDPPDDPYFELRDKTMREGALVVSELVAVIYALYPDEEHVETFALTDKLARAQRWLNGLTFMYE